MSHTTLIKSVPVRSLTALEEAVKRLQQDGIAVEFQRNTYPRMYYDSQVTDLKKQYSECHTVRVPNSRYDVGFVKQEDGTYAPVFDDWANMIKNQLGPKCKCTVEDGQEKKVESIGRLMQYYTACTTVETMEAQGWNNVSWEENPQTGELTVVLAEAANY